jgi:hypothetical protein
VKAENLMRSVTLTLLLALAFAFSWIAFLILRRSKSRKEIETKPPSPHARQPGEFTKFLEPNEPKQGDQPTRPSEPGSPAKADSADRLVGAQSPSASRHKLSRVNPKPEFTMPFGSGARQPSAAQERPEAPAAAPLTGPATTLFGTLGSAVDPSPFPRSADMLAVAKAPKTRADAVHFAVTTIATVAAGSATVVNVWAYLDSQYEDTLARARRTTPGSEPRIQSQGPVRIARGTLVSLEVEISGISLRTNAGTILWVGEISNTTFAAEIPANATLGPHAGSLSVFVNGLQIARLHFLIVVGLSTSAEMTVAEKEDRYRRAFASYASADRNEVLARVQGIQKVAPDLDVFLDVLTLRSGEQWAPRLQQEITSSDVFYLFWSANAKGSEWVEKEWRYALESRGLEFIDPVPLVSPELVPPPPELAAKHFNDWTLACKRLPH